MGRSLKKFRLGRKDVLSVSSVILELTSQVSDILGAAPVRGAAQILLSILQTIEKVDSIEDGRLRLAHRAASLLTAINNAVENYGGSHTDELMKAIQAFETSLISIRFYVQSLSDEKWLTRFLKRARIEDDIVKLNSDLDTAFASFQAWMLIRIHASQEQMRLDYSMIEKCRTPSPTACVGSVSEEAEKYGFRSYHQSEVIYADSSDLPNGAVWQYIARVEIGCNMKGLVRRYEGPREVAKRKWLRDLRVWRQIHHPHLPQLMGVSDNKSAVPFLVFANSDLRSLSSHMLALLETRSISTYVLELLHITSVIHSAVIHVQQQLLLGHSQTHKFTGGLQLSLDHNKIIIMNDDFIKHEGGDSLDSNALIDLSTILLIRVIPGSLFFKTGHISIIAYLEMLTKECLLPGASLSFNSEELEWKIHHVRGVLRTIRSAMAVNPRLLDSFGPLSISRTNTLPSSIPTLSPPSLQFLRSVPYARLDAYLSTSFYATNCWVEGDYSGLGDVCIFKRDSMRDLGFASLENIYGSSPRRYEFLPPTLLFDDSQSDGSVFKISPLRNDHCYLDYCINPSEKRMLPLDRWVVPVPSGGVTHLQLYRSNRLLCPGHFCRMHAAYLLREGPGLAAKHGLAPHEVALLTGNTYCYVYKITSTSVSQCKGPCEQETVTVYESPNGGLCLNIVERPDSHEDRLVSNDGMFRLTLRHHHVESEFTILSDEDYAESSGLPESSPG